MLINVYIFQLDGYRLQGCSSTHLIFGIPSGKKLKSLQ